MMIVDVAGWIAAQFARRNGHADLANELPRMAERARVIIKQHFYKIFQ